ENELRHYGHLLYFEYCEEYILSDNHSRFFWGFWIENPVTRQMYYCIIVTEKILDYALGICSYKACGRVTHIFQGVLNHHSFFFCTGQLGNKTIQNRIGNNQGAFFGYTFYVNPIILCG